MTNERPSRRGRKTLSPERVEIVRGQILDASKSLFSQDGYEAVSMRNIASAVGVSPMALYRYFPSKRAILVHIWDELFTRAYALSREAAEKHSEPQAAVLAYCKAFVAYWCAHRDYYKMVYLNIDPGSEDQQFFANTQLMVEQYRYFTELLLSAGVKGRDVIGVSQQLLCALHGVCHSVITIPEVRWQSEMQLTTGLVKSVLSQHQPSAAPER